MSLRGKRLALIGGGNMGGALTGGLLASGRARASQISITDVRPEMLRSLHKKYGVRVGNDNLAAVQASDVAVLCVKPQQMDDVLREVRPAAGSRRLFISIAAGVRTDFIEKILGRAPVIRVMPNTPALLRAGALVYCRGKHAGPKHEVLARDILSAVGPVWRTEERHLDAVTALSGSGPAYFFYLTECLARAGAKLKLPLPLAEALARQTAYGAGLMLKDSPEPAGLLRERVTSPGGTTEAALKFLKKAGIDKIFERALAAAARRSKELSGRR